MRRCVGPRSADSRRSTSGCPLSGLTAPAPATVDLGFAGLLTDDGTLELTVRTQVMTHPLRQVQATVRTEGFERATEC